MRVGLWVSAGVLSALVVAACATNAATGKKIFNVVPRGQEKALGLQAYQEILSKEKINKDPRLNAILQRVGKRIAAVVPVHDFDWQFVLIDSPQMNAFCLPGGKVAFYTGILPVFQNEAAMAIVMGHEIAHAVAQHGVQRMSQGLAAQAGLIGAGVALKDSKYQGELMAALGLGAQVGVLLPFSRSNETEADELGIRYAAMAGYDPAEAPLFWARFAKAVGGGKPPVFLSTHPTDSSRIENMKRLQAEAQALYQKSPKYGLGDKL